MKTSKKNPFRLTSIYGIKILMGVSLFLVVFSCTIKSDFIITESGLQYKILKPGNGPAVIKGQEVIIQETTRYTNDSLVFSSKSMTNPLRILVGGNQAIEGVDEGLQGMKKGEIRKLIVPPSLSKRSGNITFPHPDSTLVYEIELIAIVAKKKIINKNGNVLKIDKENSVLRWEGFNKLHTNGHYGRVSFHSGAFYLKEKRINGGEFIMDMNTIINTDGDYSEGLVDHLKNEDFFYTEKYPFARLEITNIKYIDASNISIQANLTIKEIMKPIEFDAQLDYKESKMIFTSKFEIDRTHWNILYATGTLFGNFGDNLLSDTIKFEVTLLTE